VPASAPDGTPAEGEASASVANLSDTPLPVQARLLASIIRDLPEGVLVADRKGRLLLVNAAGRRIIGPATGPSRHGDAAAVVVGFHLPDGVTPFPVEQLPLACALRGETVAGAQIFVRNQWVPEGVWLSVDGTPWTDEAGLVLGGVVVFRDVTDGKRSAMRVQHLSSAVEQTADSVMITETNGTIVYVNPAFELTTGYSRTETMGETPRLLRSGRHEPGHYRQLWKTLLAGGVFRGTLVNRKKNGELFHAEQTIAPIRAGGGETTHFVSVSRDITARLKAEHDQIEMEMGREVQRRLYPHKPARIPGMDAAGTVVSVEAMCGDYFDHFPMSDGCLGLAVGDVSGHGISSSLIMVQTRACLRSLALTCSDAGEVLHRLNEILVSDLSVERFVTLLLASLDLASRTLVYSNAGHLPGYLLDHRGEIRERLASTGTPLGLFAGRQFPASRAVAVDPGDIVVLFTDGITESRAPGGEEFGTERALDFIKTHRAEPAREIAEGACRAARRFAGRAPQLDDMTVFICKLGAMG